MTFDLATLETTSGADPKPHVQCFYDFPEILDNTAREQFVVCPQKFLYSTINKLQPDPSSIHLHAGGAYAAGMEAMRKAFYNKGASEADALAAGIEATISFYGDFEPPAGSNKTCERICGAIISYTCQYPLGSDFLTPLRYATGKHAIEFTFSVPLPIPHPVTGNPLLYAGRFDMLGVDKHSTLFVVDDKTTSQLGASWSANWDLNSQFTGYCWAAQTFGYPVAGAIIRGVSLLKTDYGHAQAIIYRPQWVLDRWYEQLIHDVQAMVEAWRKAQFSYALGAACSAYGGCEFKRLCLTQNLDSQIQAYYKQRHWNPLEKDPEETKGVAK